MRANRSQTNNSAQAMKQLPLQNVSYLILSASATDHLSDCIQSSLHPSYLTQVDTRTDATNDLLAWPGFEFMTSCITVFKNSKAEMSYPMAQIKDYTEAELKENLQTAEHCKFNRHTT